MVHNMKKNKIRKGKIIIDALLVLLSITWIMPLVFTILNLFKSSEEYSYGGFFSFPKQMHIVENFQYAFMKLDLYQPFMSSIFYSVVAGCIGIVIALSAAYGLTHLSIKGKMFWFMFIYSGTIFPFQMYLIPIYKIYTGCGLYDTKLGMTLIYIAIIIPFATFVFRNHFKGISNEIVESAKIDGASDLRVFLSIFVPMSKAPISIALLFQCSWIWNDLLFGMTYTKSSEIRPIMTSVSTFLNVSRSIPGVLAACVFVSIPSIILFFILHKNLEKGIVYTSK